MKWTNTATPPEAQSDRPASPRRAARGKTDERDEEMDEQERIEKALEIARRHGQVDGAHHKMWAIDQMVRALTDCPLVPREAKDYRGEPHTFEAFGESEEYARFIAEYQAGEDGPETYRWDEGIAP